MHNSNRLEPMPCGMRRFRSWGAAPRLRGRMKVMPNYQRRLAELGSRYVPRGEQIAGVDFSQLPNEVVPKFSEMMRDRVEANLRRTDNLDPNDTSYRTVLGHR